MAFPATEAQVSIVYMLWLKSKRRLYRWNRFYYRYASKIEWGHSVLEQIWIKGPILDQWLPQHESLYPIGLKSAKIENPHIGSHYIDFLKTDFY